jgi:hypothetical protein
MAYFFLSMLFYDPQEILSRIDERSEAKVGVALGKPMLAMLAPKTREETVAWAVSERASECTLLHTAQSSLLYCIVCAQYTNDIHYVILCVCVYVLYFELLCCSALISCKSRLSPTRSWRRSCSRC